MSDEQIKYKPCCVCTCCLGTCETRDSGGCYCVCRLKDAENELLNLLDGTSYSINGGVIYEPNRVPSPLNGLEKEKRVEQLNQVRERLKGYQL